MTFVLGCGGTGGHIYPAIAIAQQLQKLGHKAVFIGNCGGMEETVIAGEGYSFYGIHVQKLYRKFSLANLRFPFLLVSSTFSCLRLLRKIRPEAVISTGGFVSGPVGIAAVLLRIPLYFNECNSYPGITTKHLARYTRIIFTGFDNTAKYLPKAKVRKIGIPLPQRDEQPSVTSLAELGLEAGKPILLVTGGSQGSQAINSAVASALPRLIELGWQVIWQTGKTGYQEYSVQFKDRQGIYIFDFSPQLKNFYKLAQVAITRAGAMTITELIENRLPAVLVPLPTAAENHQYYNALELQSGNLALLLKQSDLSPETLIGAITKVWGNHASYLDKLSKIPPNTAAQDIAREIINDLSKEHNDAGKD